MLVSIKSSMDYMEMGYIKRKFLYGAILWNQYSFLFFVYSGITKNNNNNKELNTLKMIQSFVFILRVFFHNSLPDNTTVLQYGAVTRLYLHNGSIFQQFSLMKKKIHTFIYILTNCLSTVSISLKLYVTNDTRDFSPHPIRSI